MVLLVLRGTALSEPALRVVGGRTPSSAFLLVATAHILSASLLHRVLDTLAERLIILGYQHKHQQINNRLPLDSRV